jgi:hypothetical protein
MSVLGIIGQDQMGSLRPQVRDLLDPDSAPDVLRGALYAIGRIGTEDDMSRIIDFQAHVNQGVVRAANVALARLMGASSEP